MPPGDMEAQSNTSIFPRHIFNNDSLLSVHFLYHIRWRMFLMWTFWRFHWTMYCICCFQHLLWDHVREYIKKKKSPCCCFSANRGLATGEDPSRKKRYHKFMFTSWSCHSINGTSPFLKNCRRSCSSSARNPSASLSGDLSRSNRSRNIPKSPDDIFFFFSKRTDLLFSH